MEYVLKTKDLKKTYGNYNALNGISMNVPKGSIYGLIGRNGVGKTTLIRLICGLQKATEGDFSLYGINNHSKEIVRSRKRIGAVVETPSIYLDMSAEDNLKQQYRILGIPSYSTIPDLLKLVGLENTGKKKARNFSLGMRQRLGIAIALSGSPDFLILDEPINGLDPQGIIEIRELILKLNHEHDITVLISSHILDELSRIATHFGFINNVLEDCISSYYAIFKEKGITPNINLCEQKIVRSVDKTALLRIFNNVIDNAIKYSVGDLTISLFENGKIVFSNHTSDLNEIQIGKLFDRFYTVNTARKSTGLGLSIAKALIEKMDGNISADYSNNVLSIIIKLNEV